MFVVSMAMTGQMDKAKAHMAGHNAWVKQGVDDGVFVLVGNLKPGPGGCLFAVNVDREALDARIATDPFVSEGIVAVEVTETVIHTADKNLQFLEGK
ncbi:hypothetical protein CW749_05390 [Vibrio sp. vnigr-6D03]|uniref:YciI family protein n=1 Tax=Vibrio sp. vnigr-6D03 TaxID=2058088 RepID=UPI000C33B36A|nr:YciI family protein [Vibrio sp. vnigr-6D03]PKF80773.1 hypothetical protein CW749_05390 [Vibrio sp. vnigr-6D03]